jgi:hypothetical protein
MGRFETDWLANGENLVALTDLGGRWIDRVLGGRWIDRVHSRRPLNGIVLDMDSSVNSTDCSIDAIGGSIALDANSVAASTYFFISLTIRASGPRFSLALICRIFRARKWKDPANEPLRQSSRPAREPCRVTVDR